MNTLTSFRITGIQSYVNAVYYSVPTVVSSPMWYWIQLPARVTGGPPRMAQALH